MALGECYFDETSTTGSRPVFAIGGLALTLEKAQHQAHEWKAMRHKWGLSAFHMTDCANGQGEFKRLKALERDTVAREAIAIIRDTASAFVRVSIEIEALNRSGGALLLTGGVNELCSRFVIMALHSWCRNNQDIDSVHYYFESGGSGEANAKYTINDMMTIDEIKKGCKFSGSTFVLKEKSETIQAADVIAWHVGKDAKRAYEGQATRKDFAALMDGIPFYGGHIGEEWIKEMDMTIRQTAKEAGLPLEFIPYIHQFLKSRSR